MPINHSKTMTTPENPSYEVGPTEWNASHLVSLVGSEISGAFANSPTVTFGLNGGFLTASAAGGGGAGNLGVSAGTTSNTFTGITFSNSNNFSFGLNAGTITGSYTVPTQTNQTGGYYVTGNSTLSSSGTIDARSQTFSAAGLVSIGISNGSIVISGAAGTGSGVGVSAGTTSVSNGVVTFSNSNGVSFGLNAGVLTATVNPGPAAGIAAVAASNTTQTTGSLVFSNSNGLTFGLSSGAGAGTLTASYTVPATAGLISSIVASAGTQSGSQTGLTFSNTNGVSFGLNAGTITASVSQAAMAVSGSNGSFAFSTVTFGNLNGLSHYTSNGSLVASYTVPSQSNQTVGIYGLSNTTQLTSGTVNATGMTFAGAGNVSIGISNGSVVVSGAQSNATVGIYGVSQTTQNTSGTVQGTALSFGGAGNISVGISNGSVVISGATAAGLTSGGAYAAGNTTGQSSSSTHALTNFNISAAGILSAGWSSNSFIISAPASTAVTLLSVGMSTGGNTTGTTGIASNQLILAGGNNITLSGSNNAGSMSISISAMNSSSLVGAGAVTLSTAGNTITISGLASSSLSATGLASISTNGSTISIGVAQTYRTRYIYPDGNGLSTIGAHGNGTLSVQYMDVQVPLTGTRMDVLMSQSYSTSGGAGTQTYQFSAYGVIYTRNASTLSSLSSGSTQSTYTLASNTAGQTQLTQAAIRPVSIPLNFNMTEGEYYVGVNVVTANTAGSASFSLMGASMAAGQNYAEMGSATATSNNLYSGMGLYSAASTGGPAAISLSAINATGANLQSANIALVFRNA